MANGGWGDEAYTASRITGGRPSCRKCMSRRPTSSSWNLSTSCCVSVNLPITVASTPSEQHRCSKASQLPGGTERTIRSCASEIQISVYESPEYLSGALSSQTSAPDSAPISPTALENPPAPQSVIAEYSPRSRAARITSISIFSVIALPICTAPPERDSLSCVSSADENVAPWIPSRPVLPPTATMNSPVRTCLESLPTGIMATLPQ